MNIPPQTDQWPGKCSKKHANSCWTLFVPLYNLIKPSAKPAWQRVEHDIQTSKKAGTAHVHTWLPILLNVSCCTPKILSTFRRLNFCFVSLVGKQNLLDLQIFWRDFRCMWWKVDRMLIGYSRNNKEKDSCSMLQTFKRNFENHGITLFGANSDKLLYGTYSSNKIVICVH